MFVRNPELHSRQNGRDKIAHHRSSWGDLGSMSGLPPERGRLADIGRLSQKCNCRHSPNGTLWNVAGFGSAHCGLILATRMTFAHFSVSSAMSLPKSVAEPTSGVLPKSASRALIL